MQRSLRTGLLIGATLWTLGLLPLSHYLSIRLMIRYPELQHGGHAFFLLAVAAAFTTAGFLIVRRGVSPINQLREKLAEVRSGRENRLAGEYATEVQPLVDDLNALIAHRDDAVRRARAKAGDLAHFLKTPLAILRHEAERARAAGQEELAAAIAEQVDRMSRQMDYHLARARAAASGPTAGTRVLVRDSAEGLTRALERLHASREVAIELHLAPELSVRVQREDLDEMLGNLLDNACRWARSRVLLHAAADGASVALRVEDDGPGIEAPLRDRVMQRGVRADQDSTGTGFGLAIVRELSELYGGAIELDGSSLGGLRATLRLPAATT